MIDDYPTLHNHRLAVETYLRQRRNACHAARRRASRLLANLGATCWIVAALGAQGGQPTYVTERMVESCAPTLVTPTSADTAEDSDGSLSACPAGSAEAQDGNLKSEVEPCGAPIAEKSSPRRSATTEAGLPAPVLADTPTIHGSSSNVSVLLPSLFEADGQTAARVAAMIQRLAPQPAERTYELAWHIARWSRNYRVRPELVVGVGYIESTFNPSAHNGPYLGFGGLGPTVRRAYHVTEPFNISDNVRGTCAHLGTLLRQNGGDERMAAATHNGGPGGAHSAACQGYATRVLRIAGGGTP